MTGLTMLIEALGLLVLSIAARIQGKTMKTMLMLIEDQEKRITELEDKASPRSH